MRMTFASLVAVVAFVVSPATAQQPERREAFDTSGLGLTAEQRPKVTGILEQLKEQNAPYRKELDQLLGGRRFRDLTPGERDSLRPQLQPIRHKMMENWSKAREQLDKVLTPEQRKLLEQRMRERRGMRGEGPPS